MYCGTSRALGQQREMAMKVQAALQQEREAFIRRNHHEWSEGTKRDRLTVIKKNLDSKGVANVPSIMLPLEKGNHAGELPFYVSDPPIPVIPPLHNCKAIVKAVFTVLFKKCVGKHGTKIKTRQQICHLIEV